MITGHQPHLLMDEQGRPPHRRAEIIEHLREISWLRQTFDRGFAYPIEQRFQSANELLTFIEEIKNTRPINEDDPVAEFNGILNSPEYKERDVILEFIIKAHRTFINAVNEGAAVNGMGGSGPNVDKSGFSVVSYFMLTPPKRSHPMVQWNLTTTVSKDLNTISDNCDFQDAMMQSRTYMVSEHERILSEYKELGIIRGKELLREMINQIKNEDQYS